MRDDGSRKIPLLDASMGYEEGDDLGAAEAIFLTRNLSERDLKKESDESEFDRGQRFKSHMDTIGIIALYILASGLFIASFLWFIQAVTPFHFLEENQFSKLQDLLTGVLAGFGANYIKKRLS